MRIKVLSALINISNELDKLGYHNEARDIDNLIKNAGDVIQFPNKSIIPPQPDEDMPITSMDIIPLRSDRSVIESETEWYFSNTYSVDKAIDDQIKSGVEVEAYKRIIKFKSGTPLHVIQHILYEQIEEGAKMLLWLDENTTIDLLSMLPYRGNPWAYWTHVGDNWTVEVGYLEDSPEYGEEPPRAG
jgi:hypothetical protein